MISPIVAAEYRKILRNTIRTIKEHKTYDINEKLLLRSNIGYIPAAVYSFMKRHENFDKFRNYSLEREVIFNMCND